MSSEWKNGARIAKIKRLPWPLKLIILIPPFICVALAIGWSLFRLERGLKKQQKLDEEKKKAA